MGKTNPINFLGNFNAKDLSKINIEEASEGLNFGRRFKMKAADGTCSGTLLLRDIFDEIKQFAEKTKNDNSNIPNDNSYNRYEWENKIKTLEALDTLLRKLNAADQKANAAYEKKEWHYRALTFISRLFSFGTHSERISDLKKWFTENSPTKHLESLKATADSPEKAKALRELAKEFFNYRDYAHSIEAIKAQTVLSQEDKDLLAEILNYIHPRLQDEADLTQEIMDIYLACGELDKVMNTIHRFNHFKSQQVKDEYYVKVADKYFDNGQEQQGADILNLCSTPHCLDVAENYYQNGQYDRAYHLLHLLKDQRFPFAIKLGNALCDNKNPLARTVKDIINRQRWAQLSGTAADMQTFAELVQRVDREI